MSEPLVSCVTVNFQTTDLIRNLLRGVEQAHFSFPFEYFVVDNEPGHPCADMVREHYPWVQAITAENRGFGAGNNEAIRLARGKYVLLVNPDLTVFPGEVERLVEWMEAHPEAGICGPRLLNPDRSFQVSRFKFHELLTPVFRRTFLGRLPWAKKRLAKYFMRETDDSRPIEVDWILGAAMLVRRELLDKIGAFDERYFMYFEEEDLCRRAWLSGSRVVFAPVAEFVHYYKRQSQTRFVTGVITNRMTRVHLASGIKYFWKYRGQPHPRRASS